MKYRWNASRTELERQTEEQVIRVSANQEADRIVDMRARHSQISREAQTKVLNLLKRTKKIANPIGALKIAIDMERQADPAFLADDRRIMEERKTAMLDTPPMNGTAQNNRLRDSSDQRF